MRWVVAGKNRLFGGDAAKKPVFSILFPALLWEGGVRGGWGKCGPDSARKIFSG
jgi:hypothetical protein